MAVVALWIRSESEVIRAMPPLPPAQETEPYWRIISRSICRGLGDALPRIRACYDNRTG